MSEKVWELSLKWKMMMKWKICWSAMDITFTSIFVCTVLLDSMPLSLVVAAVLLPPPGVVAVTAVALDDFDFLYYTCCSLLGERRCSSLDINSTICFSLFRWNKGFVWFQNVIKQTMKAYPSSQLFLEKNVTLWNHRNLRRVCWQMNGRPSWK